MTRADQLEIDTGVAIAASPALVWSILTDFVSYPSWNRYMVCVEGRAQAGAMLRVTTRDAASRHETTQQIHVAAAAPYFMRWIGGADAPDVFRAAHRFELIPTADGRTVLRHAERFSGSAAGAIMQEYGVALRSNFRLFNRCLKEAAERRASAVQA